MIMKLAPCFSVNMAATSHTWKGDKKELGSCVSLAYYFCVGTTVRYSTSMHTRVGYVASRFLHGVSAGLYYVQSDSKLGQCEIVRQPVHTEVVMSNMSGDFTRGVPVVCSGMLIIVCMYINPRTLLR